MSTVLTDIAQLVTCQLGARQRDVGVVDEAALIWEDGLIRWLGPARELQVPRGATVLSAHGCAVVPGLVDCHTHLAFGGWRADEFAMRIEGRSYLEIAAAGGGIASTVAATRSATREELVAKARIALDGMLALGVTTVEAKSGYGLTPAHERKLLQVYRELDQTHPIDILPTYLGAHIVPAERRSDRAAYVDEVVTSVGELAAEGLARFVDVFVEDSAFTADEARRVFEAASRAGLRVRMHADQLTNTGGAGLAAEVGALSADHLEQASDAGLALMATAGVVAVLLPIATLCTFQAPADGRRMIDAGVQVAVATDFNPGSSPSYHLPLALWLAATTSRLTPAEALAGATRVAADALDLQDRGVLEPGRRADLAVLDAPSLEHWLYHFRGGAMRATVKGGQVVHGELARA